MARRAAAGASPRPEAAADAGPGAAQRRRLTGRQVWNRQRKDEVLIDVNDVALGHTTKMRWNENGKWIFSEQPVHPLLISDEIFSRAQAMLSARRVMPAEHKPHRSKHDYALRGLLLRGLCSRRMQGLWANEAPYYRCRFPSEYALANLVSHPRNVTLRQDAILMPLDTWLTRKFGRQHLAETIDELAAAAALPAGPAAAREDVQAKIATCERKLTQYRAALDAGGDPVVIARWISETEAARTAYQASKSPEARPVMTRDETAALVESLADLPGLLRDADPADKADIYAGDRAPADLPARAAQRPCRGQA
jgi:hypothetical protein